VVAVCTAALPRFAQIVLSAGLAFGCRDIVRPQASVRALCLLDSRLSLGMAQKRGLESTPDIVLDITQLSGTCSQKRIFSLCNAPIISDGIQDQKVHIDLTMPVGSRLENPGESGRSQSGGARHRLCSGLCPRPRKSKRHSNTSDPDRQALRSSSATTPPSSA
jgi:hypothetical protein